MIVQLPVTADTWIPLSPSSFVDAAVSTAAAVPTIASQGGNIAKGTIYVAFFEAVAQTQWLRFDGLAAVAGACFQFDAKDTLLMYGTKAINAVRYIHGAGGGGLAIAYYYYKPTVYAGG